MSIESAEEFAPATQSELSRFIAENATKTRRSVFPVGGRTALNFGYPIHDEGVIVSTAKLNKLVDYPVRDMTVTVEAGIRFDELSAALEAENQQLPIDVAQSHRATLGGAIATNTSGARRFGYGTLRDYVIGVSAVDPLGRLFKAGGRVVKNVAGYDLCKLLIGSMGSLAIITQVTLKLRPIPEATAILWSTFQDFDDIDAALESVAMSAARPVILDALDANAAEWIASDARIELPLNKAVLCLAVEGQEREVDWQMENLKDTCAKFHPIECVDIRAEKTNPLMCAFTEFPTFSDGPLTYQANLRPSKTIGFLKAATELGSAVQSHAGNGIVVGHLSDKATSVEEVHQILEPLRALAREDRGNLTILRCDPDWKPALNVFGDPDAAWSLMLKLKSDLDPHNLMNPGRFIDGQVARALTD